MSDLFPHSVKNPTLKATECADYPLNALVEDILHQVDEELSPEEQLGDTIIEGHATRVVKHFKTEPSSISKDVFNRNKLPANCADISVPIMNPLIREMKPFSKNST